MFLQSIFLLFSFFHYALSICPNDSFLYQKNCLFFNSNSTGFANAELECQSLGGHLASIHDAFTNAVIGQKSSLYFGNCIVADFWIGASKLMPASHGKWSWTDDTKFHFTDWNKDEPKNATGDDCVAPSWIDGYWSAENCFFIKPFVCSVPEVVHDSTQQLEKTITLITESTKSQTTTPSSINLKNCSDGWIYFEPTNSCYGEYLSSSAWNWNDSESRCQIFGAHLPSIHSVAELNFLTTEYIAPNQYEIWLGLYSIDGGNTWKWTDGSPNNFVEWRDNCQIPFNGFSCVNSNTTTNWISTYFTNYFCGTSGFHSVCKRPLS